jgi:hypothetical protein
MRKDLCGQAYKEAKVGCVCVVEKSGNISQKSYTHYLGEPIKFGQQLFGIAAAAGVAECARTVVLGDGAKWLWKLYARHFPDAEQILDWYHACEHLAAVARGCLSASVENEEQLSQRVNEWLGKAKTELAEGTINGVIALIKKLPAADNLRMNLRRRTAAYFDRNRERMHYKDCKKRGLWIGSGQIESGCKQVVSQRMKGPGMRWCEDGAMSMGALRAVAVSTSLWEPTIGQWPGRSRSSVPVS